MSRQLMIIKRVVYLFGFYFLPIIARADNFGLDRAANSAGLKTEGTLAEKSGQIIGSLLSLVGVIFLILMVYGGITWMTASGNDKSVEKAKGTISRAAIGLIIVILAYAITLFVINRL
ncbi:MAG TPA: hypothetical protein PLX67_02710 [bacterium]|nr:hypothetical protein [bacterium]